MKNRALVAELLPQLNIGSSALERALSQECPWLDGTEEINEEIGVELLTPLFRQAGVQDSLCESFVRAYNHAVRGRTIDSEEETRRNSVFNEILVILGRIGNVGVSLGSDFWMVEDSFSTDTIVIIGLSKVALLEANRKELQSVLDKQVLFTGIDVNNEDGRNLFSLRRTKLPPA